MTEEEIRVVAAQCAAVIYNGPNGPGSDGRVINTAQRIEHYIRTGRAS